ncbi:MAG: esterase-like activity of phytase family protein [Pseudomonadota bacterium]
MTVRKSLRRCVLAASSALFAVFSAASADQNVFPTPIELRKIENFKIGSDKQRFGRLEFAGGLEMTSRQQHFGALSGIAIEPDQAAFTAIADTGFWLTGKLQRDPATNELMGIQDEVMRPMLDENHNVPTNKWGSDAEGIARFPNGDLLVSFERLHRLAWFTENRIGELAPFRIQEPPVPMFELRHNRGFEAIAVGPADSVFDGRIVGVSEKSLDANRNIMAFVLNEDKSSFEFSVRRTDAFDVTDAAFLPTGQLLILERRFRITDGVSTRMREIQPEDILPGATVDGEIILEADLSYQIDNMEGLEVTMDPDGVPRLTLVSDDNHSLLQRNLIVEFRLVDPVPTPVN